MDSLSSLPHFSRRPSSWSQLLSVSLPQTIFAAPSRRHQRSRMLFRPPISFTFAHALRGLWVLRLPAPPQQPMI